MTTRIKQRIRHSWNLLPHEAMALQSRLSKKVILESTRPISNIKTVAGIDTYYGKSRSHAAAVCLDLRSMQTLEIATATKTVEYAYIPGLFSFREGPAVLSALKKLKTIPDLLIFDGHGIAHPRQFGIASHIGLLIDLPSIGCAKTRLIGQHSEPDAEKGSFAYLRDQDKIIGAAVQTRSNVKPVYVSIGHRMNLKDSIRIILMCCTKYRLPEPIRRADALARRALS